MRGEIPEDHPELVAWRQEVADAQRAAKEKFEAGAPSFGLAIGIILMVLVVVSIHPVSGSGVLTADVRKSSPLADAIFIGGGFAGLFIHLLVYRRLFGSTLNAIFRPYNFYLWAVGIGGLLIQFVCIKNQIDYNAAAAAGISRGEFIFVAAYAEPGLLPVMAFFGGLVGGLIGAASGYVCFRVQHRIIANAHYTVNIPKPEIRPTFDIPEQEI